MSLSLSPAPLPVSQQTSELENRMNETFIDYRAVDDDDYSEEVNDFVTYVQETVWLRHLILYLVPKFIYIIIYIYIYIYTCI